MKRINGISNEGLLRLKAQQGELSDPEEESKSIRLSQMLDSELTKSTEELYNSLREAFQGVEGGRYLQVADEFEAAVVQEIERQFEQLHEWAAIELDVDINWKDLRSLSETAKAAFDNAFMQVYDSGMTDNDLYNVAQAAFDEVVNDLEWFLK